MPPQASAPPRPPDPARSGRGDGREQALVPSPHAPAEGDGDRALTAPVARLPVELDVAVPVREFRVRNCWRWSRAR